MLNALTAGTKPATTAGWVGLLTLGTAVTGFTGATTKLTASHSFVDKDVVVLNSVTGGTGLIAERIYYVKKVSATELELFPIAALTGTAESCVGVTAASLSKLTELSGGSYKRLASAFGTAANGVSDDATAHKIAVPAAGVVDFIGYFDQEASGGTLWAVAKVTKETFAGAGTYEVTDSKLDLLGVA
jgi:hypothetical protein